MFQLSFSGLVWVFDSFLASSLTNWLICRFGYFRFSLGSHGFFAAFWLLLPSGDLVRLAAAILASPAVGIMEVDSRVFFVKVK